MKMLGSYELSVYEQERRKIIERQVDYYISVDQLLTDKQYFTSAEALCLPANLHEYATLLRALLAKVNSWFLLIFD